MSTTTNGGDIQNFLFTEKYRPRTIDDCILPSSLKRTIADMVRIKKEIPNMIFTGPPGCGKTTLARAIAEELQCDLLFINASEDSGIDVLRTTIREFASKMSFTSNGKIVILDECDYLNPNSTQPALRAFMEEFSQNCRFILTCNYPKKLIDPLHSRSTTFSFVPSDKEEKLDLLVQFMTRVTTILDAESISYDKTSLVEILKKYCSRGLDYRRVINEIQRLSSCGGIIPENTNGLTGDQDISELFVILKNKEFTRMHKWVHESQIDFQTLVDKMYGEINTYVKNEFMPIFIQILAEYQYKSAFVANQDLNCMACMTMIMREVEMK